MEKYICHVFIFYYLKICLDIIFLTFWLCNKFKERDFLIFFQVFTVTMYGYHNHHLLEQLPGYQSTLALESFVGEINTDYDWDLIYLC